MRNAPIAMNGAQAMIWKLAARLSKLRATALAAIDQRAGLLRSDANWVQNQ
jgi:hypothetical protein